MTSIYMLLQDSTFGGLMYYLCGKFQGHNKSVMDIQCGNRSYILDIKRQWSKVHDHLAKYCDNYVNNFLGIGI